MGLYDYTIYSIIARNAKVYSDRPGFLCGEEKISHREYKKRVDRLASGLLEIGVQKGDRVGVLAQNSMEFLYLYGASAKIGAIMLPINWRLKPEEIEYVISDGTPKVIFAGSDFQPLAAPLISSFSCIEKSYSMGQAEGDFAAFNDLMDNDGVSAEGDVFSDDAYVIIHTAAVAGKPQGATLSHMGLLVSNLQSMAMWQLSNRDCNLGMLPLFHLAGMGTCLNVMHSGGMNIVLPKFDVDLALKHIQDDEVTIFCEFPPMLTTLLERNEELKCDLSSLRIVGGLDHPDTVKKFEQVTDATFWAAFGQSETSGFVTFAPYMERPGSAGLPSFMANVQLVNDDGGFVKTGEAGEIVVRGPMVFKGYWNLPQDNEYTFRDGWHHTGDMGRFDEEGYLWYAGRKAEKELIKPGGENVYPAEVEKAILVHPLVEEASVIGVPDQQWGEAIKAVCVLKAGKTLAESDLIEFVASKIARFKKPKHVIFVPDLPKTGDGAIDRMKVKEEHGRG